LRKTGQAGVLVEVLVSFCLSSAVLVGRAGHWRRFGTVAEDTGMDCLRLGHFAKAVVSQLCCRLDEVGGVWIVEVSLA